MGMDEGILQEEEKEVTVSGAKGTVTYLIGRGASGTVWIHVPERCIQLCERLVLDRNARLSSSAAQTIAIAAGADWFDSNLSWYLTT